MAILLKNILGAMAGVIAADPAILAKCQALYGRAPSVHVGAAGYQAADADSFPAITILGLSKDSSEDPSKNHCTYDVTLGVALNDDRVTTETTSSGVEVKIYQGAAALEDILELALAAARTISKEFFYDQIVTDIEPLEFFPLFVGEVSLTLGFQVFMGGQEPFVIG